MTNPKPEICEGCPFYDRPGPVFPSEPLGDARFIIVGEAPGETEIAQGIGFVGRSGKVLRSMMLKAGIKSSSCIFANVVMCRPEGNATPSPYEAEYCYSRWLKPFLQENQDKNWIIAGSVASQKIYDEKITKCAGYLYPHPDGTGVGIPILHPAAVMRDYSRTAYGETVENLRKIVGITKDDLYDALDHIVITPNNYALGEYVERSLDSPILVIDIETEGKDSRNITIVGVTNSLGETVSVHWNDATKKHLKRLIESNEGVLVAQNVIFDFPILQEHGIKTYQEYGEPFRPGRVWEDTMRLAHLAGEDRLSLEYQVGKHLRVSSYKQKSDVEGMFLYNAKDSHYTWLLYNHYKGQMFKASIPLYQATKKIEQVAARMSARGFRLDPVKLEQLQMILTIKLAEIKEHWGQTFGDVNPNSPKQIQNLIVSLGENVPKNTKGKFTTDERAMEILIQRGGMVRAMALMLLEIRELTKMRSTYATYQLDENFRIHPKYKITGTVSGRWSCSDPNIQNVPVRDDKWKIRGMFTAQPGYVIMTGDYSQAEMRVIAILADEKRLLDAWARGQDVHSYVASLVLGVPIDSVTKEQRATAKTVVYAMSYGAGPRKIALTSKKPYAEVRKFYEAFKDKFPRYFDQLEYWAKTAATDGYLVSPFGRVHNFSGERMEMQAKDFTPQSCVADMVNIVLCDIDTDLIQQEKEKPWYLIHQNHDEIVMEIPVEDIESASAFLRSKMERPWAELRGHVIPVDIAWGETWLDCKG